MTGTAEPGPAPDSLRADLLAWFDRHRRALPWRAAPGARPDPYHVLVSEIMLQQTTVATVRGRFQPFLDRFPSLAALAAAPLEEVLHAWQGLGYYRRARALHACAREVVARHDGRIPDDPDALLKLPGLGAYSARAIAAIAFDRPVVPVDANVRRVVARLCALERPNPATTDRHLRSLAHADRAGDVAQALMDLGATVCTPAAPRCLLCPWRRSCTGHASGRPEHFPLPEIKKPRPERAGLVFLLSRPDGALLFRRRPDRGLLAGLHELPSSPWVEPPLEVEAALAHAPTPAEWHLRPESVRHLFTHFALDLRLAEATCSEAAAPDREAGFWCAPDDRQRLALPTVMRKVLRMAGRT
jgi:A/G-specific adenine glycosylase